MSLNAEFIKAIRSAIPKSIIGIVNAIDEDNSTIDVKPVDGSAMCYSVRLKAVIDTDDVSIIVIPEEGSTVICAPVEHNDKILIVSSYSKVKKVSIKNSNGGRLTIEENGKINLNGDSFSGLVKADELKTQLDKTNQVVNALVESLLGFVPVAGDGGAALKAYAGVQLAGKVTGDYSNIKNTDVNHGSI